MGVERCVLCSSGPKAVAVPCSKRCRIVFLLGHRVDFFDPAGTSPFGSPGDGSGVALLPLMSRHPSVVELERCLLVLRGEAPVQHSHLLAFHGAEWRIRRWQESRKRRNGKLEVVERARRERVLSACDCKSHPDPGSGCRNWVRLEKVRRAESRLVELFRGSASLPDELLDALTLSSEEIELKRRRGAARKVAA